MKTTSDATINSLNEVSSHYIQFVKVTMASGEELRVCSDNTNTTFRGEEYRGIGSQFKINRVNENDRGEIKGVSVTLGNQDGLFAYPVLNGDIEEASVTIFVSTESALSSSDGIGFFAGIVTNISFDELTCTLYLDSKVSRFSDATGRRYLPTCAWVFKGTECAYSGGESSCDKTLSDCVARSNEDRFGGFDVVPTAGG